MIAARWRKLARDVAAYRGRVTLMTLALAAAAAGLGALLNTRAVLQREMARNYLGTDPASATLEVSDADAAAVALARAQAGVTEAAARAALVARVRVHDRWQPLRLFVRADFAAPLLNRFTPEQGAAAPTAEGLLLERSAATLLDASVGEELEVVGPSGESRRLRVDGTVHDPSLAPAWQEQTGYAYVTPLAAASLGAAARMPELRIQVIDTARGSTAKIENIAQGVAGALRAHGYRVTEIQIPPPLRHPHQTQMNGVLTLFVTFSALTLFLTAILVATVLAGLLAAQAREVAILKAIGASTTQVAVMYFGLVGAIAVAAVAVAAPAARGLSGILANQIARLLNLELGSRAVPAPALAWQLGATLLVPLAVSAIPIWKAARATVHATLSAAHGGAPGRGGRVIERLARLVRPRSLTAAMAWRNLGRRPGRLALTVSLIAAGGAMVLSAYDVRVAWGQMVARVYTERSYDVEVRLKEPASFSEIERASAGLPARTEAEAWGYCATNWAVAGRTDVSHTYPDGQHGSFRLFGVPANSKLLRFPITAGRWLLPADRDAVVLNQGARAGRPDLRIGDAIWLSIGGRAARWTLVGFVEEVGGAGAAYVSRESYDVASGHPGRYEMIRIAGQTHTSDERQGLVEAARGAFAARGLKVDAVLPLSLLRTAMGEHVLVLVGTLLALAAIITVIAVIGVTSNAATTVIERCREFGVMRAIGAPRSLLVGVIAREGAYATLLGCVAAAPLGWVLTRLIGGMVGRMAFNLSLPAPFALGPFALWCAALLGASTIASAIPARRAAAITVREALTET